MAEHEISNTRLFPGKPITAQIIQELDETQTHIATRPQDSSAGVAAQGKNERLRPMLHHGYYPILETDFQIGHYHTRYETNTLTGSIFEVIHAGYYDIASFVHYNHFTVGSIDVVGQTGLYRVDDSGNNLDGSIPYVRFNQNNGTHYNGGAINQQNYVFTDEVYLDFCYLDTAKYRVGLFTTSSQQRTIQASGYVTICQRKEISTCPIGCERGQMDGDTGDFEIDSNSSLNTLSSTETVGRTLEPMKIYWS